MSDANIFISRKILLADSEDSEKNVIHFYSLFEMKDQRDERVAVFTTFCL